MKRGFGKNHNFDGLIFLSRVYCNLSYVKGDVASWLNTFLHSLAKPQATSYPYYSTSPKGFKFEEAKTTWTSTRFNQFHDLSIVFASTKNL